MKYYNEYINILNEELKLAMGCTEPISIAYLSSVARKELGGIPDKIEILVSGNIVKNVKSVVVPNTNGLRGINAAVAIGIIAGDSNKELECISSVSDSQIEECRSYLSKNIITVGLSDSQYIFDILIKAYNADDFVEARIIDNHTNIVYVRLNNQTIFEKKFDGKKISELTDRKVLNVKDIYSFAKNVDIADIKELLDKQIACNTAIAEEGLKNNYGANIGKTLVANHPDLIEYVAKAYAAAGSDARMNGCNMPVVINSGSGNQGLTCSLPVIVYARYLNCCDELLYRALVLSNLLTIHIKTDIGRLSAYCGAIAAGCASGAGIAFLYNENEAVIEHTLANALAISSGIICDGAKASCAAKIAIAVETGLMGYNMTKSGNDFLGGDGIVKKSIEATIHSVGHLACDGMIETDKEILKLMLDNTK